MKAIAIAVTIAAFGVVAILGMGLLLFSKQHTPEVTVHRDTRLAVTCFLSSAGGISCVPNTGVRDPFLRTDE